MITTWFHTTATHSMSHYGNLYITVYLTIAQCDFFLFLIVYSEAENNFHAFIEYPVKRGRVIVKTNLNGDCTKMNHVIVQGLKYASVSQLGLLSMAIILNITTCILNLILMSVFRACGYVVLFLNTWYSFEAARGWVCQTPTFHHCTRPSSHSVYRLPLFLLSSVI